MIFAGCLIFVIVQGSQCIMKFIEKPEAVTTSYDFAGKYPFPEITICALPYNQLWQLCAAMMSWVGRWVGWDYISATI